MQAGLKGHGAEVENDGSTIFFVPLRMGRDEGMFRRFALPPHVHQSAHVSGFIAHEIN